MSVANFMIKRVPVSYELKPLMNYNPSQPSIRISMPRLTAALNSEANLSQYLTLISVQELGGLIGTVQKITKAKSVAGQKESKTHMRPSPFTHATPFQQLQPLIIVDLLGKKQILDGKRRARQILKDRQTATGFVEAYVIPSSIAEGFLFDGFMFKARDGDLTPSQFEVIDWEKVHPTRPEKVDEDRTRITATVDSGTGPYLKKFEWTLTKKVGLEETIDFKYEDIQRQFDIFSVHCIFRIAGVLNAADTYNTDNGSHFSWTFMNVVRAIEFNKKQDHHPEKRQIKPELIRFNNYRDFVNLNNGSNFYFKSLADSTIRRDKLRAKLHMKLAGFMSTELGEAEIINRYTALSKRRNNSVSEHLSGPDYALQLTRSMSLLAYINTVKRRLETFTSISSEISHSVTSGVRTLYRRMENHKITERHEDIKYHQIESLGYAHKDYLSFHMLFDLMSVFRIDLSFLSMDCPNLKPALELLAMVVVEDDSRPTVLTPVTANHFLTYQAIRERGEIDRYWDCTKKVVDEMMSVISLDQLISDASEVVATGQAKTLNLGVYNWNVASQAGFIFAHDETQMIEIDPATGYNGNPAIETDLNIVVSELSYQQQKSLSKLALNNFRSMVPSLAQALVQQLPDPYAALSK